MNDFPISTLLDPLSAAVIEMMRGLQEEQRREMAEIRKHG